MHYNIFEPKNEIKILDVFWHSKAYRLPSVVQICIASWLAHGYEVVIWTLEGREYIFDSEWREAFREQFGDGKVRFTPFDQIIDVPKGLKPFNSNKPNGTSGYVTGFADWARYAISEWRQDVDKKACMIFDTDVVLLKPLDQAFDQFKQIHPAIFVVEESFHKGNELGGIYPVNGIYFDAFSGISRQLKKQALDIITREEPVQHGSTGPKLVYEMCKSDKHLLDFRVEHDQFFEIGYDEIDLFYSKFEFNTLRRLKESTGVHCWMSMLDQSRANCGYTFLDNCREILMQQVPVTYTTLRNYMMRNETLT